MSKVLLIDDDYEIANLVEIILSKHGFEVIKMLNAEKVLTTIEKVEPDVILLDVNVASVDGREVCKELKADDSPFNHIPVVLFSASHDLRYSYPECKATDFISKPFDIKDLVSKIKKYANVA